MSKGLEMLKEIKNILYEELSFKEDADELLMPIEKELKALEIIKNKGVDVGMFKTEKNIKLYNYYFKDEYKLTQEEYDLLKEIL